jgi:phospholipase/carboxylesterase
VPQAPYPLVVNGALAYEWAQWPSGDADLVARATDLTEALVLDVVQDVVGRHDAGNVYLLGFSQGAIIAYLVGIKHHYLFDGLIILSGPGLLAPLKNPAASSLGPDWLPETLLAEPEDLRVFITHGEEDQAADYSLGIRSRDVLTRHGHDVTFRGFKGAHVYPSQDILQEIAAWIQGSDS